MLKTYANIIIWTIVHFEGIVYTMDNNVSCLGADGKQEIYLDGP